MADKAETDPVGNPADAGAPMSRARWCVLLALLVVNGCGKDSPTAASPRVLEVRCPADAAWKCDGVQYQGEMMLAVTEKCVAFTHVSGAWMRARMHTESGIGSWSVWGTPPGSTRASELPNNPHAICGP